MTDPERSRTRRSRKRPEDRVTDDAVLRSSTLSARPSRRRGVARRFERLKGRFSAREGTVPRSSPLSRAAARAGGDSARGRRGQARDRRGDREARPGDYPPGVRGAGASGAVDVTLPGRRPRTGAYHPLTIVRRRIEEISSDGVLDRDGRDRERFSQFEALNFPRDIPARHAGHDLIGARPPRRFSFGRIPRLCRSGDEKAGSPLRIICRRVTQRRGRRDAFARLHRRSARRRARHIDGGPEGHDRNFPSSFRPGTKARFIPTSSFVEPGADVT